MKNWNYSTYWRTSGFWQLQLEPTSRECTMYRTGKGKIRMGHNAHGPTWSTRLICKNDGLRHAGNTGHHHLYWRSISTLQNRTQHLKDLEQCFQRLTQYNLKINLTKCIFAGEKIPYLGYTLTKNGVSPGEEKTKAVQMFPEPDTVKRIKEFTGLTNYFRHMIPGYTFLSSHLTQLTAQDSTWKGGYYPQEWELPF